MMAICTEYPCEFRTHFWEIMRKHYKDEHPDVTRPDKYFTKEWRTK